MTQSYFIAGTGTDIGKTFIACSLIHQLRQKNISARGLKPVITGYEASGQDDLSMLSSANGDKENPEDISLYRFMAPVSPDIASRREVREIDFMRLVQFCQKLDGSDITLIEGLGGIMVPLTKKHTTLDLIEALAIPTLLVAGSYLGAISHTLTALEALDRKAITVTSLIINESESSAVPPEEMRRTLQNFISIPITVIPRIAAENAWKKSPDILHCLDLRKTEVAGGLTGGNESSCVPRGTKLSTSQ